MSFCHHPRGPHLCLAAERETLSGLPIGHIAAQGRDDCALQLANRKSRWASTQPKPPSWRRTTIGRRFVPEVYKAHVKTSGNLSVKVHLSFTGSRLSQHSPSSMSMPWNKRHGRGQSLASSTTVVESRGSTEMAMASPAAQPKPAVRRNVKACVTMCHDCYPARYADQSLPP